ncbi:uncharacterized protein ISCGN_029270 [Ixodes scapularis]
MATDEATPLDITVVRTLRLPRFWTADPQLWFAQVESQFTTSHITSQAQRFHHVVAALPPETAVDIRDIILEPPTTNPYDTLKAELIKRTSASEHRRLQQLLTSEELGDRTPSQLLRRLQQLLGERAATFDPALLRELFLQRLPNNLRMVLTSASGLALVQLAQLADTVMEVAAPQVAPIAATQSHLLGASANISAAETTEDSFRTDIQQAIKTLTAQPFGFAKQRPAQEGQATRSPAAQSSAALVTWKFSEPQQATAQAPWDTHESRESCTFLFSQFCQNILHFNMFRSGKFMLSIIVLVALLQLVYAVSKEGTGQGGFMASMEKVFAMIMDYIKKMFGGEGGGAYAKKAAAA